MNKSSDSVRIVIFSSEDPKRFLVLTEADDPENWKLPGGKFNTISETPNAAAARELYEELGVDSNQANLVKIGELTNDDGVSARYIYTITIGAELKPSLEIAEIRWVKAESVPEGKNKDHILSAVAQVSTFLGL